ncbi:fumarylacetoacetate hydrolase family protein [Nitrospirales bacterium NOB]|nr:fumarylacetoacetate hydrolase family protein [Nitrospirales bacterium NOB]
MKLVSFQVRTPVGAFTRVGAVHKLGIVDLNMACARELTDRQEAQPYRLANALLPPTMLELLEGGESAMAAARRAMEHVAGLGPEAKGPEGETIYYEPTDIGLIAPLPNPPSLRDFIAFEAHIAATSKRRGQPIPPEWYKAPAYYKGNPRTVIGPDHELAWPLHTTKLDYELELACVIGRTGINVPEREAAAYIAGYTIMNDFSARDVQFQEMACRLGPAKGKDFATAIGPCLVTTDDLPDLASLRMVARVNGETWSEGRFGTIHWSFAQMIEHVSRDERIYPGDIFGSGTIGGGCGLEQDRYLQPGDLVELEVQPIGILRTTIASTGRTEARR